jgi:PAS domain S-box-containing protein
MDSRSAAVPPPVRVEHAVAHSLATASRSDDVYRAVLATIGSCLGWDLGAAWEIAPPAREHLRCVEVWCATGTDTSGFEELSRRTRLARGVGLPGRVWESGDPCWIPDVTADANFPRAAGAAAAGLHAAYCFPICGSGGVLGAVEFFTTRTLEADEELLATMTAVGSQIGQYVERRQAQEALADAAELKRAILDAALDCIVVMDQHGRVLEFNPAAERTFGYRAEEALGAPMVELIVPPSLRHRHLAGLERYLRGGEAVILDRRLELTAMRRDGSEFPVELTIVRIDLPGPPRFTGYLRDITERKHAEEELRASRARIVEAADAERRRLERDLHDGAQQRLVSLALALRLGRAKLADDPTAAGVLLDEAIFDLQEATVELRELAHGIHPAVLTEGGLAPSLVTLLSRASGVARLVGVPSERFPAAVEAAVYFVVAEALTNVSRYADATGVDVEVRRCEGGVELEIRDDGKGGADPARGSGLRGMADRVAAFGGTFEVASPAGGGTTLRAAIPCAAAVTAGGPRG